jgi:hypothetical protein
MTFICAMINPMNIQNLIGIDTYTNFYPQIYIHIRVSIHPAFTNGR